MRYRGNDTFIPSMLYVGCMHGRGFWESICLSSLVMGDSLSAGKAVEGCRQSDKYWEILWLQWLASKQPCLMATQRGHTTWFKETSHHHPINDGIVFCSDLLWTSLCKFIKHRPTILCMTRVLHKAEQINCWNYWQTCYSRMKEQPKVPNTTVLAWQLISMCSLWYATYIQLTHTASSLFCRQQVEF